MDTQTELFFKNSKLLGLGRQIGPKFYEAFGVFLAKLYALFWNCESLVHGKMRPKSVMETLSSYSM